MSHLAMHKAGGIDGKKQSLGLKDGENVVCKPAGWKMPQEERVASIMVHHKHRFALHAYTFPSLYSSNPSADQPPN